MKTAKPLLTRLKMVLEADSEDKDDGLKKSDHEQIIANLMLHLEND